MFRSTKAGCTINNMPMNPIKTADHLFIPTFSDKNIIENIVTKIGPAKVSEITSASGKFLKAIKSAIIATAPLIALKACKIGLLVL